MPADPLKALSRHWLGPRPPPTRDPIRYGTSDEAADGKLGRSPPSMS
jgi:hypothetical protein